MKVANVFFCLNLVLAKRKDFGNPEIHLSKCYDIKSILDYRTGNCVSQLKNSSDAKINVYELTHEKTVHVVKLVKLSELKCSKNSSKITFSFKIYNLSIDTLPNYYVINEYNGETISIDDICVDITKDVETHEEILMAQKCMNCPVEDLCINFCCPEGQMKINNTCQDTKPNSAAPHKILKNFNNFTYFNQELVCDSKILKFESHLWDITQNGVVIDGRIYDHNRYCIDGIEEAALVCGDQDPNSYQIAKIVVMSVSFISIVIVIIFSCVIDEMRNCQATVIKITLYLFFALSFAIILFSSIFRDTIINSSSCIILGLFLQFSVLSIFFWITFLSISIWLRFHKIQNVVIEGSFSNWHFLFPIICPTTITTITSVLQLISDPEDANYIHPRCLEK